MQPPEAIARQYFQLFNDRRIDEATELAMVRWRAHGWSRSKDARPEVLTLPATRHAAELPFTDRLEFRDGLIVSSELNFDVEEMKRRLFGVPV